MAVSDIIPFGQRPELHTLKNYLLGAGTSGPTVELKGLESEEKDSFKVTRSWPVTQGLPLTLHKLAEGLSQQTLGSDPLFKHINIEKSRQSGVQGKTGA